MKLSELVSARHLTDEQRAAAQELQGRGYESFTDIVQAIGEPALAILSSTVAEPLAGLAALGVSTFGGNDRAVNVANLVKEKLTYVPRTEAGGGGMDALGRVMRPVGEALQTTEKFLGDNVHDYTGSDILAAAAATIPAALMELNPAGQVSKQAAKMDIFAGKSAISRLGASSGDGFSGVDTKDRMKGNFPEVKAGIRESEDSITLDKVIVPDELRGEGVGTKFMEDLIDDANSKGKAIGLTPSSDFGGSKKRLTEFYKRFGFVENKGKNKDHSISETMIKTPTPSIN